MLCAGILAVFLSRYRSDRAVSALAISNADTPPTAELATVRTDAVLHPLTLPGETAAWFESTIFARVNGYVAHWSADIGDHVTRGQVLATIETPDLDAAWSAAKAKELAAEAEIALRSTDVAFARTTYDRWRDSPKGVVSDQEREDKKAQFARAQAQLAAAQAEAKVDQAEIERLASFQRFKQVTAPYAGTITERRIDIGNLVTAGSSPQTTLLYRMVQVDPVRVFVDVPQSAAPDLMKIGSAVDIAINDQTGSHLAGRIARTSAAIDPQSRTFRVEIDLANPDQTLLPGMYVAVSFPLPAQGGVSVPAAALLFRSDGPSVARVDSSGHVHFISVKIARDDGNVILLADDPTHQLAAGDQVALNLGSQVAEGASLQVSAIDGKVAADNRVSSR
jgi:RND family efflux transporter MFP subunit